VNRLIVIAVVGIAAVGAAAGVIYLASPPSEPAVRAPAAAPRPEARPEPAPEPAPPPVVRAEPAPRPEPRRPAAPIPEATPVPAAVAPPDLVTLRIDSDVPGSQVFVDRVFLGKTPLTTTDVKPGSHRLNVSAPGYEGVARDIEVTPGTRDIAVRLHEVRLNAALDVVHKHRLGSCKGRLSATPAGLQYETTDKDDAFSISLLDLDTFEVDYLDKNLRIRPRQGKRYDFTDPDGNADNLFVFHRDVEKARERLKKGDPPADP
jgi:hypothetical protein